MKQIRKITIGPDLKNGMHYIVGQKTYGGTITDIIEKNGSYDVYVKQEDEIKPWFSVTNQNIKVEYNLEY